MACRRLLRRCLNSVPSHSSRNSSELLQSVKSYTVADSRAFVWSSTLFSSYSWGFGVGTEKVCNGITGRSHQLVTGERRIFGSVSLGRTRGCGELILLRHGSVMDRSLAEDAGSVQTVENGELGSAGTEDKPLRFAILTTGYGTEYCEKSYGGYGPMFARLLSDPGEIWDEYFVVEGQFPIFEDLQRYDGFVVTGSRHDAHGNEEWIEKLCGILRRTHELRKKSVCVCFGHQVLSRALGGKTGRAPVGWEVGVRNISLTDAFFSKPYGAGMSPKLRVLEVHRDQVLEMPPGAELLASSERTPVEMYAIGDHILAIQGHPEFFDDVVSELLDTRLASLMTEEEIKQARETLAKASADQKAWKQLCKAFLKGRHN